jgi:hypothetical protein
MEFFHRIHDNRLVRANTRTSKTLAGQPSKASLI